MSVEAVLASQRDLAETTKDKIGSRVASTLQLASIRDTNLTTVEKHDENIVILPAEKGCVTVVMDKLVKRDPAPSLQRT